MVLALLITGLPAGCLRELSVRYVDTTAVFLDGGEPAALFHPCGGGGVWHIVVWDESDGRRGRDGVPMWDVYGPLDRSVTEVRLLNVPTGWRSTVSDASLPDATLPDATLPDASLPDATLPDATPPDATLPDATTGLRAGRTYWLYGEFVPPRADDTLADRGVHFTLDEVSTLIDGHVWAEIPGQETGHAVTRAEFFRTAEQSCRG